MPQCIAQRNRASLGASDSNREHPDTSIFKRVSQLGFLAFVRFTIAYNHDEPTRFVSLSLPGCILVFTYTAANKKIARDLQSLGQIGSLIGNRAFVKHIEGLLHEIVIRRQRNSGIRRTCERHNSSPIPRKTVEKISDDVFGLLETAGNDILREHAVGHVEQENHVQSLGWNRILAHAKLGSRQS